MLESAVTMASVLAARARQALLATAFLLPACVVRLNDRNAPAESGAVTGAPANCAAVTPEPRSAPGGDAAPKLVGRWDTKTDPARPRSDWSGNYVEARFEGTRVAVGLEVADDFKDVLYTVAIDEREPFQITVTGARANANAPRQTQYELARDLPPGEHRVRVHRDTEAPSGGVVTFTGFDVAPGRLLPPLQRARRIEAIGDSITCGYGSMGGNATCPYDVEVRKVGDVGVRVPVTENQFFAYTAIVGRELDADVTTICWSGKGVGINYRESEQPDADGVRKLLAEATTTMPDFYKRILAYNDEELKPPVPAPNEWDFASEPEPQVVLVNLGTNDFTRDQEPPFGVSDGIDLPRFRATYLAFVERIRQLRPNAHIFMMVPPMVSDTFPLDNARRDLADSLRFVVAEREAKGDRKVYAMDLVEQGTRYGLGCDYHPNLVVHRLMADQVLGAVRSKTCW